MGGGKSSTTQKTQATQTTTNIDQSLNSGGGAIIGGSGSNVTVNDVSGDVAGKAIDLAGSSTAMVLDFANQANGKAIDLAGSSTGMALDFADKANGRAINLAGDTTNTAFAYLGDAGTQLLNFVRAQAQSAQTEKLNNQELTANLAQQSFALADQKTQTQSDQLLGAGKIVLYIAAALAGLFLLIFAFKKKA